ncbi:helix-turn-helix domain-containing protein [Sporosarcina cyprini]|uniref:helix-turn-helix domain-containing protein n=1 Tax=Sporosarcina cyprini TaxID=2910523 RepID=UPI001EDFD19B|nr:helix-turn-helix domain-containing protein [Sporosarcina cyprini]
MCLIDTLGERIRTLRKQRKMTLEALAGDQLTKGMLSLIENNKANPSMESLTYIASRLEVEVAVLLEEGNIEELRSIIEKADALYHVPYDEVTNEHKQILKLIEPVLPKLTKNYESARLLDLYGRALYFENDESWHTYTDRAANIYEDLHIIYRRAAVGIFRAMAKFAVPDYTGALATMLEERKYIESTHAYIEAMTRIDLDYHEAVLHFAVGDSETATNVMEQAINYSKEQQVFYKVDHLYRLAAIQALMSYDEEKMEDYRNKLIHYSKFIDDEEPLDFTRFLDIHRLTSYCHEYEQALSLMEKYSESLHAEDGFSPYVYLETGKALFGVGRYEEAIESLLQVNVMKYIKHPIDLSLFYEGEAYLAKSYAAIGEIEKAKEWAQRAWDHISVLPDSHYKKSVHQTYEQLM